MAQSYLIFDFGSNEEAAQAARHKLDGWQHAFRLGRKLTYKIERTDAGKKEADGKIRLLVRLDFSGHEKLSHTRWLERIPAEEQFKGAAPKVVSSGDASFESTSELFESLD